MTVGAGDKQTCMYSQKYTQRDRDYAYRHNYMVTCLEREAEEREDERIIKMSGVK